MINRKYWEDYYDFWNEFVRDWFCQRPNMSTGEVSAAYEKRVKNLEFDELPEPYYGFPHKGVKAVVINLNPGVLRSENDGENLERQKFYKYKDTYNSNGPFVTKSLVKEFAEDCNMQYSHFVQKWSCLNPKYRKSDTDLCGVKWWQGTDSLTVGGRMKWLGRIYNKNLDVLVSPSGINESLHPLEVFSLELCPYHSKSFDFGDNKIDDKLLSLITKRVIRPALNAVVESKIDFAVAIGKPCAIIFEKFDIANKFGISAKLEKEWWDESEDVVNWDWPKTKDKKTGEIRRVHRKYCLFALRDKKSGRRARFLVCVAPGSNGTPGEEFETKGIERLVRCYVAGNSLTEENYNKLKSLPLRWWNHGEKKCLDGDLHSKGSLIRKHGTETSKTRNAAPNNDGGNRRQYYQELWRGFCNWCRANDKKWNIANISCEYNKNYFNPAGSGIPHLFFRVGNDRKLYLGIYSNARQAIKQKCQAEIERLGNVNWNFGGENQRTTSILVLLNNEGWRNPDECLYDKMAKLFEDVDRSLRMHGFRGAAV